MSLTTDSSELTTARPARTTPHFNQRDLLLIAILVLATVALYVRSWNFDFVMYDDPLYVSSNIHVQQGLTAQSLQWAFTALPNGNWHPLTNIVQLLISSLFGVNASAFHGVNIVLHTLNVVLLYTFLRKATGQIWPAFYVALLWGLHPERVESVAWVSELKDVLCGVFWLGCMIAYVHYARRRTILGLILVTLLQTLSLLSKPMAVTLPILLLLLDYWPLSRPPSESPGKWWLVRVIEKLPMLALALWDIRFQKYPINFDSPALPLSLRLENAVVSYAQYVRDIFFPRHLSLFYPHPIMYRHPGETITIPIFQVVGAFLFLLTITVLVSIYLKKRPYLAIGWFWFLGTLIPVIGLVQAGQQARADRFTYLPSIGICLGVVWFFSELCTKERAYRRPAAGAAVLCTLVLWIVSAVDLRNWRDSDTLFGHVLQIQPRNYLAMAFLSARDFEKGDINEALPLAMQAVKLAPFSPDAHKSYALALQASGRLAEAGDQGQIATQLEPEVGANWDVQGRIRHAQAVALADKDGTLDAKYHRIALADFKNAITANNDDPVFYADLALEYASVNQMDDAIAQWEIAVAMQPGFIQAQGDLADALRLQSDLPGAIQHYRAALAGGSNYAPWETNLAYLIATSPEATDAEVQPMIAIARDACEQTKYQDPAALDAYAACLARSSLFDPAIEAARRGIAAANAAHNPTVAKGIEKHLSFYLKNQPFIKTVETTQPATTQSATTQSVVH